jgi:signal transduction histidine kinase
VRSGSSQYTGYLAIIVAGLLLCLGVQFEADRQYLTAWQNHLSAQQNKSRDYTKKVSAYFSSLNDNLGAIAALPNVRKLASDGSDLRWEDRESVQQVYNSLAKNVNLAALYVTSTGSADPLSPVLIINKAEMPSPILQAGLSFPQNEKTSNTDRSSEYLQLQKHLKWFANNYPRIETLKTFQSPMVSDSEVSVTTYSSVGKTVQMGLIFSVPYYGPNGFFAGCISALVPSSVLRDVASAGNVLLISPHAEFLSVSPQRNKDVKMMLRANDTTPDYTTIYAEAFVIDTHDVRGMWQLDISYSASDYYKSLQYRAIRVFEYGAYGALAVLTLLGIGWQRSTLKRAQELRENAAALQGINDDVSKLNMELADRMRQLSAAQDEIIKKGKLAQMGQLVATVAHELRNPLASVRTSAFLLRRKLGVQSSDVTAQLLRIDKSVTRCDAVITQFLDYAKSHKLEFVAAHFDNWVAKLVEEEANALPQAVAIECILGMGETLVTFDQSRLSRVLINLMNNASEAMVGQGQDISKFACPVPKITISTQVVSDRIEIAISDIGPGITDENLEKIREPLFTTKNFGTGLGLPAVIQVLQQHGGGLDIDGGMGRGATFTAWLPRERIVQQAA